ncbi:glycoside hydrolase family 25 protein, partial [Enorma massiliensis]|uniref:glycoside hydrolase family 25 protein n=1 Tax=Enorma massiliensis TaxID=1472761 RepID=UPI0034A3BACC
FLCPWLYMRFSSCPALVQDSHRSPHSAYSMDALPSGATAQGIDVSVWQGDIDWQKVKDAGIDFAIIRLGYWTNGTDKKLERNVSECERLGIPWGAYLYSYCSDPSQAAAEADHAIDLLNQLKAKGHTPDLPVYFDMEDDDLLSGSRDFAGMATQFCSKVEAAGYTAGVYANKNWWTNYLTSSVFNNWSRWVAQYNSVCTYGGSYDAWQYTSSGSVPGISGGVDMNWWYGVPDCSSVKLSAQADGSALSLSTSGFTTAPKNVAFAVTSSTGTTKWYQAYQQPDESWTASPSVAKDFGAYGTYSVSAWATFGISTISVATASAVLSAGDVEASASVSGESLE